MPSMTIVFAAYYDDVVVGAVCTRLEGDGLYIMTIGCLAPYRRLKIGTCHTPMHVCTHTW